MTHLIPLAAALHHAFPPDQLAALHGDAVDQVIRDTEPWGQLVDALFIAAHPREGQLRTVQVDLAYLDKLTTERDHLKTELAQLRQLIDKYGDDGLIPASALRSIPTAKIDTACAGVLGSSRRAQDGWDPTSPQHAVIRAAIAWRVKIAEAVERSGAPPRVWADEQDLALIAAVDALGDRPEPEPTSEAARRQSAIQTLISQRDEALDEATRLTAERDEARQDYRDLIPRIEQAERDLANARHELKREQAALDEATETLGTVLAQREQLAARLRTLGEDLGDPPVVDVEQLLAATRAALLEAVDDGERAEAVEELLEGWYAAWPDTAVTSPHYPIAGELVRLLAPGPVTLTIPADLWAGLADRIRAGHDPEQSIVHETQTTHGCPDGPHGPHLRTDVGPNDLLIRSACLGERPEGER